MAKARARPTRCCMPPDSSSMRRPDQSASPTSSSFSATMRARSARGSPRSSRPSPTFSATVRQGSSAACWNTMLMRRRRAADSAAASQRVMSTLPSAPSSSTSPRVARVSPLAVRSNVDLPEPERPITTQISPGATARLASRTATVTPQSAATCATAVPASRAARARRWVSAPSRPVARGKTTSTPRNSSAAVMIRSSGRAAGSSGRARWRAARWRCRPRSRRRPARC